jgi:hypothetical protein
MKLDFYTKLSLTYVGTMSLTLILLFSTSQWYSVTQKVVIPLIILGIIVMSIIFDVLIKSVKKVDTQHEERFKLLRQEKERLRYLITGSVDKRITDYWNSVDGELSPDVKLLTVESHLVETKFCYPEFLDEHIKDWILKLIKDSEPISIYAYMHWQGWFREQCPILAEWYLKRNKN